MSYILASILCGSFVAVPFEGSYICAAPDYYKEAGIRRSLTLSESEKIAANNNAILPTPEMVDAIWQAADLKLSPSPIDPNSPTELHNQIIENQIGDQDYQLIAGHKKDIVQSQVPGRVTIYGWHRQDGTPIQPVSSVHAADYTDYSHGLRLVRLLRKGKTDE